MIKKVGAPTEKSISKGISDKKRILRRNFI